MNFYKRVFLIFILLIVAFLTISIFLKLCGKEPFEIFYEMFKGSFGSWYNFSETLVTTIPILLCALAVVLPARAGLINLGAEGQLHIGAIACTFIALNFPDLPGYLLLPFMGFIAALAGGFWGAIPGFFRAKIGVNETIFTLLMNYIAILFVEHLVHGPWRDTDSFNWPFTPSFSESAILPMIPGTRVHLGLLISVILLILLGLFFYKTKCGFALKVVGNSPRTAEYARISTGKYILMAMIIGGACAAIAGFGEVSVIQGRLRPGISPGYGYSGFLVVWLAGNRLKLIPIIALLLGALLSAGDSLQLSAGLPYATLNIIQGIVFLSVLLHFSLNERFTKSSSTIKQR